MDNEKAMKLLGELAQLFGAELCTADERRFLDQGIVLNHPKEPYEVGGTKQLKNVYGEGKTRTIINRAIRAEIPGGGSVLDARTSLHKAKINVAATNELDSALFDMENEIRRRYGMNELDD